MKHCKTCQLIYDDHSYKCDRCEGVLNEYHPDHDIHNHNLELPEGAAWVELEPALPEFEAQSHIDYLKSIHIPAIKVMNQKGVTMEVYLGQSVYGYDVYVPEKMIEEAKVAVKEFMEAPFESEE